MDLDRLLGLDSLKKSAILLVLMGAIVAVSLIAYSSHKLKLAHQNEALADQYRQEATVARAEAEKFKTQAEDLTVKLAKANDRVNKLQTAVDKIVVPPKPSEVPPTVKETLDQLSSMGLQMVFKPSTMIAPSVAGITGQDASKVWLWGKEAMRVPSLEMKLEKTADLAKGLDKARGLAESIADSREKEAVAWHKAADLHQTEAGSLRVAVNNTKSALAAERKKKYLYSIGAFALGYVATKR